MSDINKLIGQFNVLLRRKYTDSVWNTFVNTHVIVHAAFSNTSIEGTQVTLEDTYDVLENMYFPTARAIAKQEVINYKNALNYIHTYKGALNCEFIKCINATVLYPTSNEGLRKDSRIDISDALLMIIERYNSWQSSNAEMSLDAAVDFHLRFEQLHPFREGNGRTGRIIFSWMMERSGLPLLVFSIDQGRMYFIAIRSNNVVLLKRFFIICYERLFDLMITTEEYY